MNVRNCVIGGKAHAADVGLLCDHHFTTLGTTLRDIEDEATVLSAVPSMQQQTGNRGGSLASQRTPARLEVLVHNDPRHGTGRSEEEDDELAAGQTLSILNTLHSWARIVREERDLTPPDRVTISGERDTLVRHLPWIAAQDWCDEAYGDVRKLLDQLRAANGTRPDRPYSYCPVILDGLTCSGQVWIRDEMQPVWRRYPDRCAAKWEQAPGAAVCDTCGASWATSADKARLRKMIDDTATELARPYTDDGQQMRTATELADDLGLKVATVRMRLSRASARAIQGSYYDPRVLDAARHAVEAS